MNSLPEKQKRNNANPTRPRRVPLRTCIACRRNEGKRAFTRLVRDAEGRVQVDLSGKKAGRGAYLCARRSCWEAAFKRRMIGRALRVEALHPDDLTALRQFAEQLPQEPDDETTSAATTGEALNDMREASGKDRA